MISLSCGVGVALLVVVITFLAKRGTVPLNGFVGIRTPRTMRSPEAWRKGHAAALPVTIVTALAAVVAAVVVVIVAPRESLDDAGIVVMVVTVVGLIAGAVRATLALPPNRRR